MSLTSDELRRIALLADRGIATVFEDEPPLRKLVERFNYEEVVPRAKQEKKERER